MWPNIAFPFILFTSNSSIKVTCKDELIVFRNKGKNLSKLTAETFFVFLRIRHCRCIYTYDRSRHILLQRQPHCHYPITYRRRNLLQKMYHGISDSETYSRFSPLFLRFATPEECVAACQPSFSECSYVHPISTELLFNKGSLPFRSA